MKKLILTKKLSGFSWTRNESDSYVNYITKYVNYISNKALSVENITPFTPL